MRCASCDHDNRDGAKFCEECAAPLKRACASCGAEVRPAAKFCDECGAPLPGTGNGVRGTGQQIPGAPSAEPRETRKVISVVFADLMGSTALQERLDPESVNRVMDAYYDSVRGPVETAGGTVVQLLGDGVLCAFGIPQIAEDDALRAVRAAVGVQQAFRDFVQAQQWLTVPIGLRVAVNTGEVVVSDEHPAGIGDPLNVAARLQQEARDGEVLIGPATRRLVADAVTLERAGVFALKGRAETVTAYRVLSLERPTGTAAAPFVGRDEELARLNAVYEEAVGKPAARLAMLLGSPGLGKSRLIAEMTGRVGGVATVVTARCDAVGGATFAPVAEALRELLGSDLSDVEALLPGSEADRARVAKGISALLAGSPASPEETFFVIRRFLAALARQKPVVLVIDDLQWAEPLLLDLVEHLIQWGGGVPLFVLIGARPELRDVRSSLVSAGGVVSDVLTLSGLDAGAAMRLAANVIGAADLPAAVAAKVLATSEGNPLFVGELVRMLVDEGAIERQGERWVVGANLAALEMPPTIHALLAARIERLKPEERTVLERAAVVGRHFSRSAVAALFGRDGNELDALLEALRRTELIEPDTGWFLGEPVLRFHHVLIRDAAYRRLLKGTRVELHERLANWIEERGKEASEHDETIGWHLEQAHQLLRELGPLDANGHALGERAAKRLAAAGRAALARDDVPVAADLLGRAIDRLDADDPARADLALDWCEALLSAGDVGNAARAIEELARFAAPLSPQSPSLSPPTTGPDRLRAWHTCFAGQLTVMTAPQELQATAQAVATAAEDFAQMGNAAGEAKAHSVHAQALARLGRVGACEAALDRALAAARTAGDRRRANAVLAGAPLAALWGPSPVTRASGRCLDVVRVLRITQGAPAVEATALSCQGVLEALRGRTDAARRMIASSRKMVEDLGIAHRLFEADVFAGRIDLLEGDAEAAERTLRAAYDGLRALGLGIDAARAGALLGRALLAQDRSEEAEALSRESEVLAGDDLQAAIAWRGVRAQALALRGEHPMAIELAQAAVAIAGATDALLDHADARLALAAALRAAGRSDEADREEHRAVELWEAKGASLLAKRARSPMEAVTPLSAAAERPAGMEPTVERRIRPNAATAMFSRYEAAFAARDVEALIALHSEDFTELDHPTGASYGHAGVALSMRKLMSAENPWLRAEHLATLGESLELARRWIGASGGGRFGVGPYDREEVTICEADARGRIQYVESFAPDRLGDAVVRLYECYAESLPAGAERERAVATARTMVVVTAEVGRNIDELAAVISPGFESVDHRPLSTWSQRGGEAFVEHMRALQEVADDIVMPVIDVLALEPHAVLIRRMHSGSERVGGGSYERPHLGIFVTGADGRLERYEIFDDDCQAAALARFDEIAGPNAAPSREHSLRRRVQTNAATRAIDRFNAAIAARDMEAVAATYSDKMEVLYHPTGATYGKEADVATWRRFFGASRLAVRHTPIATLGDSLVLLHEAVSHAGIELKNGTSVGPVEVDRFVVYQVGEDGRTVRSEVFDTKHLGDAIARLYEGQAALNAEGPERDRLATIARVYRLTGSALKIDTIVPELFAPDAECSDHRTLGTWSARGAEAIVQQVRGIYDVASEFVLRDDDVLALDANAVLTRRVHAGTERRGGGSYERGFLSLFAFAADGRIKNVEMYDVDREAEALARFDELTTAAGSRRPVRRIRPNTAARSVERFRAALVDGDWDTVEAVVPPHCEVVWHPTGSTFSGAESVASFRPLRKAKNLALRDQTLATLGDFLALTLRVVSYEGLDTRHGPVGPVEVVHTEVLEVDEQGRARRSENFATDHLGDAIARLYERHAELQSAGPERERAAMTARSVRAMLTPFDLGRDSPDIVQVDHRVLGNWGARGSASVREQVRALHEVAEDAAVRDDAVLALEPTALLVQRTHFGTERRGGGVYETPHLVLMGFGGDGRLARVEFFDLGKEAEALARFAELVDGHRPDRQRAAAEGSPTSAGPAFANTATRLNERFVAACDERDWEGLEALHAPSHHYDDRRRLMRLRTSVDLSMAGFRVLLEVPGNRWIVTPLATRGDRLVLSRVTLEGEAGAGGGPVAIDYLVVDEIDDSGRFAETVLLDPDDLDAAYAELDARWQAGEARVHPVALKFVVDWSRCFAARNWDGLSSLYAPDLVSRNHRLAGWGTLEGAAAQVSTHQSIVELAPDTRARIDHVRSSERALIMQCTWHGTHDGGLFESSWVVAAELNNRGQVQLLDAWDDHRANEALARFAELAGGDAVQSSRRIFANAASRIPEQIARAWASGDWETFKATHDALHSPTHHYDDRRALMRIRTPLETSMEGLRFLFDVPESRLITTPVATRGERLALTHLRFEGDVEAGGGALELEMLALGEVDPQGRCETESILFDPDDLDTAYAQLDARFAAGEGAAYPLALAAHRASQAAGYAEDWSGFAALHASGFEYRDHRLLGWGSMDLESLVRALQSLFELSADARYRHDHLRLCSRGSLRQMTVIGTRDGGAFENPLLAVTEVDENGKIRRMDTYDIEDHDRALAHFDAIRRSEPSGAPAAGARNALAESVLAGREDRKGDPLAVIAKPNAAFAAMEHWRRTYDNVAASGNWDLLRALHAPDMVFEDRRRLCLLSGGLDLLMAATRERIAIGARAEPRLVGTAGDRICVLNVLWSGGPSDAPFEIEYLSINQIDEDGKITAILACDSDDPVAVQSEAWKRWAAIEPELAETLATVAEACDAFNAKRRAPLRVRLDEDLLVEDRRHAGMGHIKGAEAYTDSLVALWQLAPKNHLELGWFWPTIGPQGGIFTVRRSGEIVGGGDYESVYLALLVHASGRWKRLELFELDDLDIALARFEQLGGNRPHSAPLPVSSPPENAALRSLEDGRRLWESRDFAGVREKAAPDFRYEDRSKRALVEGDIETWIKSMQFWPAGTEVEVNAIATVGDRISLDHTRWWSEAGGDAFEIERIRLFEVDEQGRPCAAIHFDLDDRKAAFAEANARFARGEAAVSSGQAVLASSFRALAFKDWKTFRALLADDFVHRDHRTLGLGSLDPDTWIESLQALSDLTSELTFEPIRSLAWNRHGDVRLGRQVGEVTGGGAFENLLVVLQMTNGRQICRVEIFDADTADHAIARFEELCREREKA